MRGVVVGGSLQLGMGSCAKPQAMCRTTSLERVTVCARERSCCGASEESLSTGRT